MKIIYRNVSQVVETIKWQKVTKDSTSVRTVVIGPLSDFAATSSVSVRVKVLSNPTTLTSCNFYLAPGSASDMDNVKVYYGGQQTMNLEVGAILETTINYAVRPQDLSNNLNLKFSTSANTGINSDHNVLKQVTWEVEYIFS